MKVTFQFVSSMLACVTVVSAWAQNPTGIGFEAAKAQLDNMEPAEGLAVQLFASEPMVMNPTSLDIDPKGRVWVTEGVNYRQWQPWGLLRPEGDRILILEDTNQDGEADKSTVFYQGHDVNAALGLCVLGNQIIVACSPNIIVFTDTDGDDKADEKEILFTGIGGIDHDQGAHGPAFGPDGKLYFNFGNRGSQISHANGSPVTDSMGRKVAANGNPYRGGMAFRSHLDGSDFEVLGYNFRNPFEQTVDSFGAVWQSELADQGAAAARINEVLEFGNYGYLDEINGESWSEDRLNMAEEIAQRHWHQNDPGVMPTLLSIGSGAPKGITVYESTLLPTPFQNQIIFCDSRKQVVRALITDQIGAGYNVSTLNILSSNNPWFRPNDVGIAPDGSLMIADWNDALSAENQLADQLLDSMSGRIYRIAPADRTDYTIQQSSFDSAKEAVQALKSPNTSTRYSAWKRLNTLGIQAMPELLALWRSNTPHFQARALHLLSRISSHSRTYLMEAIGDGNASIRATAIRIAREQKTHVTELIKLSVKDPSPLVRRECAIALRHSKSTMAPELWATLAIQYDGKDRWYLEALGIGAQGNEDACFKAWLKLVGKGWNTPSGRDIVWRIRSKFTPAKLVTFIKDPATDEPEKARYRRALDFFEGSEKNAALLQLLDQ